MPWMPLKSWFLTASMTACVLLPPMPSMTGKRPSLASNIVLITNCFSSAERVGASEVVPKTTKKSAPLVMTWFTMLIKASTSTERSVLKGVTRAMPMPLKGLYFIFNQSFKLLNLTKPSGSCVGHGCWKQGRWLAGFG